MVIIKEISKIAYSYIVLIHRVDKKNTKKSDVNMIC